MSVGVSVSNLFNRKGYLLTLSLELLYGGGYKRLNVMLK